MGNISKRKRKRGFEWNEKNSVPEDLDTLEEEESENSLTIHSASYRKLRLLSTSSDDSGIAIEDADSDERDTDHDSEDETDSCEEKVTGRHILHSQELEDSLQEAAMCAYCLDGKLELWQDSTRRRGLRSALFWRCSNGDCDGKRTDFPSSDKNGRFYAINRQSVLAGRLCGNGHNALQKFSAAMDLPPPVTPKGFKKHEMDLSLILGVTCGVGVGILFVTIYILYRYCCHGSTKETANEDNALERCGSNSNDDQPESNDVPSATAHSLCTLNGGGGGHRLSPDDVCSLGGHSDSSIDSGEFDAHVGGICPDWYQRESAIQKSGAPKSSQGNIHIRLHHDITANRLIVNLIKAKFRRPSERVFDTCDSCVRVVVLPTSDGILRQTAVTRKASNQLFDDFFTVPLTVPQVRDTTLCLQLYDVDKFSRSTLNAEARVNLWELENMTESPTDVTVDFTQPKKALQDLGELQLSLSYLPTAERMTVTVLRALGLRPLEISGNPDPFVEVSLILNKKTIKKKKTSVKIGATNPIWNEALVFNVPTEILPKISLVVTMLDQDLVGHCEVMGYFKVGPDQSKDGKRHWDEMAQSFRKTVTLWHNLHL